jgi:hypothetical protein
LSPGAVLGAAGVCTVLGGAKVAGAACAAGAAGAWLACAGAAKLGATAGAAGAASAGAAVAGLESELMKESTDCGLRDAGVAFGNGAAAAGAAVDDAVAGAAGGLDVDAAPPAMAGGAGAASEPAASAAGTAAAGVETTGASELMKLPSDCPDGGGAGGLNAFKLAAAAGAAFDGGTDVLEPVGSPNRDCAAGA